MPSKYVIRAFEENSYFHVFNRGVEKREIFIDEQDHNIFLYYLFVYTASPDVVLKKYPSLSLRLQVKNLSKEIEIIAFCLMPNHFHQLIKQHSKDGISKFMKQLINAYTLYFNQKYKRTGALMQGRFKAAKIKDEKLLVHISRYIHLNPVISGLTQNPENYKWSSYLFYLGGYSEINCKKEQVLSNFTSKMDYKQFVMDQIGYAKEIKKIKEILIDD